MTTTPTPPNPYKTRAQAAKAQAVIDAVVSMYTPDGARRVLTEVVDLINLAGPAEFAAHWSNAGHMRNVKTMSPETVGILKDLAEQRIRLIDEAKTMTTDELFNL